MNDCLAWWMPLRAGWRRTKLSGFAVRVFPVAIIATVPYSVAVSKRRRPFLPDGYFLIAVRLRRRREEFTEPDFALSARAEVPVFFSPHF